MPATTGQPAQWNSNAKIRAGIKGHFTLDHYRTGLSIHTTDTVESRDMDVALERPACLTLGVILNGELEFTLSGQRHCLQSADTEPCRMFVIVTDGSAPLVRHVRKERRLCKVHISVDQHWIEQQAAYSPDLTRQLQQRIKQGNHCEYWRGNTAIEELARKIIYPAKASPALQQLQAEYHGVELLCAAFGSADVTTSQANCAVEKACHYIDQHLDQLPRLEGIATHAGLSISTLQRHFKMHYGQTVMHYIRSQKLLVARNALQRNEISIGEAAYLAGYKHPSNFVTAYKRVFGITPGHRN